MGIAVSSDVPRASLVSDTVKLSNTVLYFSKNQYGILKSLPPH